MDAAHQRHRYLLHGKPGQGSYGRLLSEEYINFQAPALPKILDMIEKEHGDTSEKVFSIGDFGCADASSSFHLIRAIIETMRHKKGEHFPITVVYEDQVSNDFNSLFNRLHGIIDYPRSYLPEFKNVYTSATGNAFYNQCVLDNSLDVIMAFMSPHWLPERPTRYKESLYRFPNSSEEERALVAARGAEAWETFLLHRAKELKPGGLLFVSTPCEDPDCGPGQSCISGEDLHRGMVKIWKSFVHRGFIEEDEFYETNLNLILRNKDEFSAPFVNKASPVSKARLKLLGLDVHHVESIFKTKWRQTKDSYTTDDKMQFAYDWVMCNRVWSNSIFMASLSDKRSHEEAVNLVDLFYDELIQYLGQNSPGDLKTEGMNAYVFVQKERI